MACPPPVNAKNGRATFTCINCPKVFTTTSSLRKHMSISVLSGCAAAYENLLTTQIQPTGLTTPIFGSSPGPNLSNQACAAPLNTSGSPDDHNQGSHGDIETNGESEAYPFESADDERDWSEKATELDGELRFEFPGAGKKFDQGENHWEKLKRQAFQRDPLNPWYPFADKRDWEIAEWLTTISVSQKEIDRFLQTIYVKERPFSFKSARELYARIEEGIEDVGGPAWHAMPIKLKEAPKDLHTLYLRDIVECAKYLMGRPTFSGHMNFSPVEVREMDGRTRIYNEVWTGKAWHAIQEKLPVGTTVGSIILASDKTHLTNYSGDISVHALYLTLGNISKKIRNATSRQAYILIAYLPISKWEETVRDLTVQAQIQGLPGILNKRLFHFSLEIVTTPLRKLKSCKTMDPDGYMLLVIFILMVYIADLEEQWMVAALAKNSCPHCLARTNDLGSSTPCPPRTSKSILDDIALVQKERGVCSEPWQFALGCKEYGLCGVEYPFWSGLPFVNICTALSQDLLHGYYKFFFDHPFKWNTEMMGEQELDLRMKAQIHQVGIRTFPRGVSHMTQMSGREHRDLQRVHLGVVAHSPGSNNKVHVATRSLLDYIYLAQYPSHSDTTLSELEAATSTFHDNKSIWIENGSRQGKNGTIEHQNIPKLHNPHHIRLNVELNGTADNYSTEAMEHYHVKMLKDAYPSSNRQKGWQTQTIRWLIRREKIFGFSAWLRWIEKDWRNIEKGDEDSDDDGPDEEEEVVLKASLKRKRSPYQMPAILSTVQKLSIKPAFSYLALSKAQIMFNIPTLQLALKSFLLKDTSDSTPLSIRLNRFETIDVWLQVRVLVPGPSQYYEPQWRRARANPGDQDKPASYDAILFAEDQDKAQVVGLAGYRAAQLRLIFRPRPAFAGERTRLLAYVDLFSRVPANPESTTKLFKIHKAMHTNNTRMGQIIDLSQVIKPCPLMPVLPQPGPESSRQAHNNVTPDISLETFTHFFINRYSSHIDYECIV